MRDFEQQKTGHNRNIRQEVGRVISDTAETKVLHGFTGKILSEDHQPLMGREDVQQSFGISGASLMAVIDLPVKGVFALGEDAMDSCMDRKDRASAYCFLGSAPGESPRYYLLDRAAASANSMLPIDELGVAPLEKGDELIIGRSPRSWMPSKEYDLSGNEVCPGYDEAVSKHQATLKVSDGGYLGIYDMDSKNGTTIMYNGTEQTPHHISEVEYGLGAMTVDNSVEQIVPIENGNHKQF